MPGRYPRVRWNQVRNWSRSPGVSSPRRPVIRFPTARRLSELGEIRQKSGKVVLAWAAEGDLDPATAVSNTFEMEWPPRSGRIQEVPEIDRVAWFGHEEARVKIKAAQVPFLDRLQAAAGASSGG